MILASSLKSVGAAAALMVCATSAGAQSNDGKPAEGVGFMVPLELGVTSVLELSNATVCLVVNSAAETSLTGFLSDNGMRLFPVPFDLETEAFNGYLAWDCDVLVGDIATLESQRLRAANPADYMLLPETIAAMDEAK